MPWTAFDTPLGPGALAWSDGGLTALFLPGGHDRLPPAATTAAPPPWINALITRVRQHVAGDPQDFSDTRDDFSAARNLCASCSSQPSR
jgi:hypothetical protein